MVLSLLTKRGKAQEKATVNFKASYGINSPVKFPEYLGSADYAMLYNEAIKNDNPGIDPSTLNLFSDEAIANFRKARVITLMGLAITGIILIMHLNQGLNKVIASQYEVVRMRRYFVLG